MIIGSGMVAGACRKLAGWDKDVLFASGVSNSSEKDEELFRRELMLVAEGMKSVNGQGSFIYFSTTSIFDVSKSESPYILHKLRIEKIIRDSGLPHMIVRLPNLVGHSNNPNTLTNYFAQRIRSGKSIRLYSNAKRHLIDVDDLADILGELRKRYGHGSLTVNVNTDRPLTPREILSWLEEAIGMKAVIASEVETGYGELPVSDSSASFVWNTPEYYHRDLMRKYYSQ